MGHGPSTFKESDLVRALRAAQKAGRKVTRVELEKDGKVALVFKTGTEDAHSSEVNEWDEAIYGSNKI
jgi:hypothetical protein